MVGHTQAETISLIEDGEDNETSLLAHELEVQGYESAASEDEDDGPEYITIDDDDDDDELPPSPKAAPKAFLEPPTEFELPSLSLDCGVIRAGRVVELRDQSKRNINGLFSGDFLLVKAIIENLETQVVVLRGFRMRRCSYLRPLFDTTINELFMLIHTSHGDDRPAFLQGIEDIGLSEVVSLRRCMFTHLSRDILSIGHVNSLVPLRVTTNKDTLKNWIFNQGTLICRVVHVVEVYDSKKGTSYAGEIHRLNEREVKDFGVANPPTQPGFDAAIPTPSPHIAARTQTPNSSHKRVRSLELLGAPPPRRNCSSSHKTTTYTLGDGFCGCGGTTDGATQAGLCVRWALENDATAMAAHKKNCPNAMHLEMDAWDFTGIVKRCMHGVDIIHFSCPCQFWAMCKTVAGINDEANMMTIYIPLGWLQAVKPRLFTMEQSPGLIIKAKHRLHFRRLLGDFLLAGYNVRYQVQDQACFGIGQQRRRLIFHGAKIGQPLPPFPKPTHGPRSSGLKRYVTIADALRPLERDESRYVGHKYHQKQRERKLDLPSIDPHTAMSNCITTHGGTHYSGKRTMTVLELAALQGFRIGYQFSGSVSDAKKQVGNAWSPRSSKPCFLHCAATLEAFDNGIIDAEDDIQDLYEFLEAKGVVLGQDVINIESATMTLNSTPLRSNFRYISRLEKTVKPRVPLSLWGRKGAIEGRPRQAEGVAGSHFASDGTTNACRSRLPPVKPRGLGVSQEEQSDSDDEVVFLSSTSRRP